ncbi:hypothetical protein [Mesorhizobium sp. B1-1-6]|uniref:hypothetical protein n=1 Tax=Mesorhizobium sp. B1-1-6 TaxID=2589978 RepID=UPI00112BD698|nr:hypothetical protein [Mesorhizobium sp. B1-1-6]TPN34776.1 hypothetical protein FJ979_21565 [Mesorhizobium sp. B1-1-6]
MTKENFFKTEAELCAAFVAALPAGWTAYAETAGYDILLVRADGVQVGVEAKLRLNAEVVVQAAKEWGHHPHAEGPDFCAALVPAGHVQNHMAAICAMLGITVITVAHPDDQTEERYGWRSPPFRPDLPNLDSRMYWSGREHDWYDRCPASRCGLPEYVPDVGAGHSAPVALTNWKIQAIKLLIIMERRGFVTKGDFKHVKIDPSRWTRDWLERGASRGQFITGRYTPDLKAQHPVNWAQIEADFDKWKPADEVLA